MLNGIVKKDTNTTQSMDPTQQVKREKKMAIKLDNVSEICVLANAMYKIGNFRASLLYASNALNLLQSGSKSENLPKDFLKEWDAPNPETLLMRLYMKLYSFSAYLSKKKSPGNLKYWMKNDPDNPEPLLRYGLLQALKAHSKKLQVPPKSIENLITANNIMKNNRSASALLLAERGNMNKLSVPYDGHDLFVYPDIKNLSTFVLLEQGDWFEDDIHLFRALIEPGHRVLDLGSNVGVFSLSAAKRVGENGQVISVEPSKDTYSLINQSSAAFNNWKCYNAAVSDECGHGYLNTSEGPEFYKLQAQNSNNQQTEPVEIFTIDSIAEITGLHHFDIIKMDLEGHEIPALKGAKKVIEQGNPIIIYEVKEIKNVNYDLIKTFKTYGYDSYYYCLPKNSLIPYELGDDLDVRTLNMFAIKPESVLQIQNKVNISVTQNKNPINLFNLECESQNNDNKLPIKDKAPGNDFEGRFNEILSDPNNKFIPRVPMAGKTIDNFIIMHNGLKTASGDQSYYGSFSDILIRNKGVHEPQEERVFMEVLKDIPGGGTMLELGSYWAFYSMWFNKEINNANCHMIEPDLKCLNIGKRNFDINNMKGQFTHGSIGKNGIQIDNYIEDNNINFVDILHSDIQGAEYQMLQGAEKSICEGKIKYIFISTHSQKLHYKCLDYLFKKDFSILANADFKYGTYCYDGILVARNSAMNGINKVDIALRYPNVAPVMNN